MGKPVLGRWTVFFGSIRGKALRRKALRVSCRGGRRNATARASFRAHDAPGNPSGPLEEGPGNLPARAVVVGDEVGPALGTSAARRLPALARREEEPVPQTRRAGMLPRAGAGKAGGPHLRPARLRFRQAVARREGRGVLWILRQQGR